MQDYRPAVRVAPLFVVLISVAAVGPVAAAVQSKTFACVTALETMYDLDGHAVSGKPDISKAAFVVQTGKKTDGDDLHCDTEIKPAGFRLAYCSLPIQATIGSDTFYGDPEEKNVFRGYLPFEYFVLFPDKTFLWSSELPNGVLLQSGTCTLD
jgi:hypothetical protein